ncbi:MAG: nucleotide exchange factor GrpE [Nitrospirota bacterium]
MDENEAKETELREEQGAEAAAGGTAEGPEAEIDRLAAELREAGDKYLRLYAEFENYRKRVAKDKEELVKYANESLLSDLLPAIDNLEMALKHSSNDVSSGLVQGVEMTLKEMKRSLEKYGLTPIEAEGKPFDPAVHHAIAQIERDGIDENMVVEEYRKGYMFRDKVLRASLVAVSKKPEGVAGGEQDGAVQINKVTEEES